MSKPVSFAKRVSWRLEAFAYDAVRFLVKPLSWEQISGLGSFILSTIGPLTSKHKIAETGLRTAFPDASDAQIKQWLKEQWDNTGRTFAEFLILDRLEVFGENSRVTVKGLEHIEKFKDSGEAAVLVSGHFANWEMLAAVVSQSKMPSQITYRKINNPHIDKRVRDMRDAYGIKLMIPKSGARGAKQLLQALSRGESVGLMNDQKFNEGISIPFFGEPAMTAPGPTRMALRAKVPLLLFSTTRDDKTNFTVTVHPPIMLEKTGDRHEDIRKGVRLITDFIEDRIRENPGQWFWVHRRWPKSLYKKAD